MNINQLWRKTEDHKPPYGARCFTYHEKTDEYGVSDYYKGVGFECDIIGNSVGKMLDEEYNPVTHWILCEPPRERDDLI